MGVRVHLQKVATYGRLQMSSFSGEIAGTTVWCLLMGGARLREVSVSGGSTVLRHAS